MSEIAIDGRRLVAASRYLEIGQYERALEALAQLDPELAGSARAMWMRGFAQLALDDFDRAAQTAREGLVDEPDDPSLLHLLSQAEARRGDLAVAERAILAALAVEPSEPALLSQYADVLMRAGQLDKAEEVLGHAAAAAPDSSTVLEERIMLARLRHDDRRAQELTNELLARDPESAAGQRWLGVLEWQRGDARSSSERFAQVVRHDPGDHDAADAARATRRMSGPLWWPTRLVTRFGAGPTWIVAVATIFGLRAAGLDGPAAIAAVVWLVICVSTWIGGAVLRKA